MVKKSDLCQRKEHFIYLKTGAFQTKHIIFYTFLSMRPGKGERRPQYLMHLFSSKKMLIGPVAPQRLIRQCVVSITFPILEMSVQAH